MRRLSTALFAAVFAVAACSAGSDGAATIPPSGDDAWRTASIRDVVSGEDFRIADLEGKVVAIEAMAIWCVNCRLQQLQAQAALQEVDSPDVVYLSLDVDPNERAEDLAEYARREGFDWRFAVASPDVARSLAASFGDQILSPPATPLVVLGPDGQVVEQHIGIKGAGALAELFEEHLP
jgi:thiol-disulfide isomerase/thioredoxin